MSEAKGFLQNMLAGVLSLVTALATEFRARAAGNFAALLGRALDPLHPHGHAAALDLLKRIMPSGPEATVAGDPDASAAATRIGRGVINSKQIKRLARDARVGEPWVPALAGSKSARKGGTLAIGGGIERALKKSAIKTIFHGLGMAEGMGFEPTIGLLIL
jgi:hypothetical protein